ncbi:hypothetical protein [Stenotrophomonas maltophilia]|jgi:hypothetical protein|uniref:hypothetical protein n=1 Tax=Stenotrophomonas maltophilia TaxID=40324 RepID=UPI0011B4D010|nr:hypothetical protein [Stenotrophomonas maltophilia]MDV5766023.1 hypothetical protein [Stenotrophomonas maltophilia]
MNSLLSPYAAIIAMEQAKIAEYEKRINACRERISLLERLPGAAQDDVDTAIERKLLESSGLCSSTTSPEGQTSSVKSPGSNAHVTVVPTLDQRKESQQPETNAHYLTPVRGPELIKMLVGGAFGPEAAPDAGARYMSPLRVQEIISSQIRGSDGSGSHPSWPKREVSAQALDLLRFLEKPASTEMVFEYVERRGIPMNRAAISTFLYTYRTKYGFLQVLQDGTYLLSPRGKLYVHAPERANVHFVGPDASTTLDDQKED